MAENVKEKLKIKALTFSEDIKSRYKNHRWYRCGVEMYQIITDKEAYCWCQHTRIEDQLIYKANEVILGSGHHITF